MDIEPGTVVANRYRISRPLGRGGMGEVFAAENIRTGRPVAVKLLRQDSKAKSSAVARFRQEARAAGSINSDHVTQVLDVEEDPEHGVVLVFELLEGESLIDRLKRTGPIPFEELFGIIEQVWMGLADAHRVGIVHRDLKPSNVFLERRPDGTVRVKILDFGISKLPKEMGGETLTEMGQSLGTFSFMPPEQIGKAKTVDHRADIYACATMIYQSLTGQLPYSARNILVMVEMKSKTDPRRLAEAMGGPVDPRLEAFIAQGLARDLGRRYQTALDALTAWRELRPRNAMDPVSSQRPGVASPRQAYESGSYAKPMSSPRPMATTQPAVHDGGSMGYPGAPPESSGVEPLPSIVDHTTDSAATLAMPSTQIGRHGPGAPPQVAPRLDAPPVAPRPVGFGGTQPVMLVRPATRVPSSQVPSSKVSSSQSPALPGQENPPNPKTSSSSRLPRVEGPVQPDPGSLQPHPAGYYLPPSVAAALAQQASRPVSVVGGEPMGPGDVALPRLTDDPTSMPVSSSSDRTQVYRPRGTGDALPAIRRPESSVKRPRRTSPWTFLIGAIVFLLVGFFVVATIMRYLART